MKPKMLLANAIKRDRMMPGIKMGKGYEDGERDWVISPNALTSS
jgi:hypothetical protein